MPPWCVVCFLLAKVSCTNFILLYQMSTKKTHGRRLVFLYENEIRLEKRELNEIRKQTDGVINIKYLFFWWYGIFLLSSKKEGKMQTCRRLSKECIMHTAYSLVSVEYLVLLKKRLRLRMERNIKNTEFENKQSFTGWRSHLGNL